MKKKWEYHLGELLDAKNNFSVIDCEACGFRHIIPIPTAEELEHVYREEYYSTEKPLYLKRMEEDLPWWNLSYGDRYDSFEELLPKGRRILDVGSGPGYFLLCGKKRKWRTLGVEPSSRAAAYSRKLGLKIVEDFLTEKLACKLGKFDVVHMSEVLEHIPDPAGLLEVTNNLLNPGGLLCVVIPNDYSPFQYVLRKAAGYEPWWVSPPHHINYFDAVSLENLLKRVGFNVVLRESTFPIDMFLLMGDKYVGNDALGRECHGKRKQFELNMKKAGKNDLKRKMYRCFSDMGIGREIILIGKKI
jgi:SAM-dependent methyltransferase